MSAPKPWERANTNISSLSSNPDSLITPSNSVTQPIIAPAHQAALTTSQSQQQNISQTATNLISNLENSQNGPTSSENPINSSDGTLGSNSLSNNFGTSSYSSPYGSSMYGGGGGMYGGGMYGGGMYGGYGGMYGRGMYGGMYGQNGGMLGNSTSYLERMQGYVFQLCEIAQMVEYNAHGLHAFFTLLKNLSLAFVRFMKDWAFWVILSTYEKIKKLIEYVKRKFNDYFMKKDLNKEELQTQLSVFEKLIKVVFYVSIAFFLRTVIQVMKARRKAV